ncbi:MAG: phosphoribosylaminoimidazolesuccinocarboxamide synthase [Bifidobacteriaceae bacterium]|nr:phosphoribosylaminoimidazolesuccinocarboxamide synthase [Bifidobacteriaceae bacterium]
MPNATTPMPNPPVPVVDDLPGWRHVASGKVRDLYLPANPSMLPNTVMLVASDRISAFDVVLPTPIPDKGRVLTALTVWWLDQLRDVVPNHLVSLEVPQAVQGRAMICRQLDMFPVECVARGYLTGSGLKEYKTTSSVCGIQLPFGLVDASRLEQAIFTPASKAEIGEHDQNISFEQAGQVLGEPVAAQLRDLTLALYTRAEELARHRGIILADTKFEFGRDPVTGVITLGDEVLTPDSSRFWDAAAWQPGGTQPSFDKQFIRDWLAEQSNWSPHQDTPPPAIPDDVVAKTTARYREAYQRLTGRDLD